MYQNYIIICIVIVTQQILQVESYSVIRFRGIVCDPLDKEYLNFTLCRIKAIKRDIHEISVHVKLLKLPINNVTVYLNLKRRGYTNATPLLQVDVNACKFLKNTRQNPLADWFYKVMGLEEFSNLNHTCPYNHDLILDKYRIDQKFTAFTPLGAFAMGSYTLHTKWYTYNVARAIIITHFEITEQ